MSESEKAQGIRISTPFIRLEALLKFAGLVPTGGEAKAAIQEGLVKVDGAVCTQRGRKLYPGSIVDYDGFLLRVEDGGNDAEAAEEDIKREREKEKEKEEKKR